MKIMPEVVEVGSSGWVKGKSILRGKGIISHPPACAGHLNQKKKKKRETQESPGQLNPIGKKKLKKEEVQVVPLLGLPSQRKRILRLTTKPVGWCGQVRKKTLTRKEILELSGHLRENAKMKTNTKNELLQQRYGLQKRKIKTMSNRKATEILGFNNKTRLKTSINSKITSVKWTITKRLNSYIWAPLKAVTNSMVNSGKTIIHREVDRIQQDSERLIHSEIMVVILNSRMNTMISYLMRKHFKMEIIRLVLKAKGDQRMILMIFR